MPLSIKIAKILKIQYTADIVPIKTKTSKMNVESLKYFIESHQTFCKALRLANHIWNVCEKRESTLQQL